ncbi:MAG: DUF502 domain-containing protein [Synechocystis sp.]|nr:DUF502 domain-containing protein [Synechocystis sp.]
MNGFIKNTIIGGIFFLIPIVFVTAILSKAFKMMKAISLPLSQVFGADSVKDVLFVDVLTILCLLFACFLAGLLSTTKAGRNLFRILDSFLRKFIPGYTYLKNLTSEFDTNTSTEALKPVLIRLDDQSQIGLEVERTASQQVVVFIPGSPDSRSGNVVLMDGDRVTPIDANLRSIARMFKQFGKDTSLLLEG